MSRVRKAAVSAARKAAVSVATADLRLAERIEAMKQEQEAVQQLLEHERQLEARNQELVRRLEVAEGYKRQQPWWIKTLIYLLTRNDPH